MVLSLEELGPAVLQATNQGPDDTATAASKAAAQPVADLGQALQAQASGRVQAETTPTQQNKAEQASPGVDAAATCPTSHTSTCYARHVSTCSSWHG